MVTRVSFPGGLVVSAQQECCSWTLRAITKLLLRRPDGHVFLHKEDLWWESSYELVPARPGQLLHHWHRSAGVTPQRPRGGRTRTGKHRRETLTTYKTHNWDWACLYCVLYFAEENREAVFAEITSVDKKKKKTQQRFSLILLHELLMGWKHLTRIRLTKLGKNNNNNNTENAFLNNLLETAELWLIWRRLCLIGEWTNSIVVAAALSEFLLLCCSSWLALKDLC